MTALQLSSNIHAVMGFSVLSFVTCKSLFLSFSALVMCLDDRIRVVKSCCSNVKDFSYGDLVGLTPDV